jgi:hypothetical protein
MSAETAVRQASRVSVGRSWLGLLLLVTGGVALSTSCKDSVRPRQPEEAGAAGAEPNAGRAGTTTRAHGGAGHGGGGAGTSPAGGIADESGAGPHGGEGGVASESGGAAPSSTGGSGGTSGGQGAHCTDCSLEDTHACPDGQGCFPAPVHADTCRSCLPAGANPAACTLHSDCAPGFACTDGVCRLWCEPALESGAAGSSGSEQCPSDQRCIPLPEFGSGACFPCGECSPTNPSSCKSTSTCGDVGQCTACARAGKGTEGDRCEGHSDCAHGLSCVSAVCRYACDPAVAAGALGACPDPLECVSEGASGGLCFPCGQCRVFSADACPDHFQCIDQDGCSYCLPYGVVAVGDVCADHSDCAVGSECADGACRTICDPSASSGAAWACGENLRCLPFEQTPEVGVCRSCTECEVGKAGQCASGFACRSVDGCAVCVPGEERPGGTACETNGQCLSRICLDGFCRGSCPGLATSQCTANEQCFPATSDGLQFGACLPCGECDPVAQSGCSPGESCLVQPQGCSVCYVEGTKNVGEPCTTFDCAAGLTCANGVCLGYCDPSDTTTCAYSCSGASALPAGVGICVPCGECSPGVSDVCGTQLKCDNYGGCTVCETNGGSVKEGESCQSDFDCGHDLHCFERSCRHYCELAAASSGSDACPVGRTCASEDDTLTALGAGICLP